jgi:pimeloyl-ACP methyl ester carboxylesterase
VRTGRARRAQTRRVTSRADTEVYDETVSTTEVQLSHGDADVGGGIRLHYVEAGEGPLVVLLHGFPEFWYSWRHQIGPLAEAGYHVVAPDMRGYDLSDKPHSWRAYDASLLAGDIAGLIRGVNERTGAGERDAFVVGHDWGAAVAYSVAMFHPDVVRRLAILNVPHTARMLEGFRTLKQLRKSWYMFFFQIPRLPEHLIGRDDFSFAKRSLRADSKKAFTDEDLERYVEAWSQPGALTGMINYYRAALRRSPRATLAGLRPIPAPTMVIWGMLDRHLGSELAEPAPEWVPDVRMERIPDATHWVQHDAPARVNELLIDFLGEDRS